MSARVHLSDLLAALEQAASTVTPAEAPSLLGELEKVRAAIWLRMTIPGQDRPVTGDADEALDLEQAARRLGISPKTLANGARGVYAGLRINTGARRLRFSSVKIAAFRQGSPSPRPPLALAARRERSSKDSRSPR